MNFKDYAAVLCHNLIENGFQVISQKTDITDYTPVIVLMKNVSPVVYFVNVINADFYLAGNFERQSKEMYKDLEENIKKMYCSSAVSLNLLVTDVLCSENKAFCDEKEVLTGEKIANVWWTADLKNNLLYTGKKQPSKLMGIEKIIDDTFFGKENVNTTDINKISKDAYKKSILPVKSRDMLLTYALIFFNAFIFAFTYFSGNIDNFLIDFSCNGEKIWAEGEWYRLITPMFFHVDWSHIIFNAFSIYIFGSRMEMFAGKLNTIAVYIISGIGGCLISSVFGNGFSVGASGAICGLMGAVLIISAVEKKDVGGLSYFTMVIYSILVLAMGLLGSGVDNYGHIGGFVTGAVIQYAVLFFNEHIKNNNKWD